MNYLIIILSLLVVSIIVAVFAVIWRDRRDLKLKQISSELERIDDLYIEIQQYKKEMKNMLDIAKKQTDSAASAASKINNQIKQVRDSVAKLERSTYVNNTNSRDAKDSSRGKDRQQKNTGSTGRSRSRSTNRRPQASSNNSNHKTEHKEQQGQREHRIDDGEKYSKMMKLAEQGLSNNEIAKKLDLGCKEVELVTQIKRKNIS